MDPDKETRGKASTCTADSPIAGQAFGLNPGRCEIGQRAPLSCQCLAWFFAREIRVLLDSTMSEHKKQTSHKREQKLAFVQGRLTVYTSSSGTEL